MADHHFWLSDAQFERPQPLLPNKPRGVPRVAVFNEIFAILAGESEATDTVMIDATHLKAHRTAASLLKKVLFPAASDVPKAA